MTTLDILLATPPPERLFHYTNASALHGILSSRKLRATMLHYLNDAQEFKHGLGLARSEILLLLACAEDSAIRELLSLFADSLERIGDLHICVFCFSEKGDVLSQWRSYCPPDGGYALGFDVRLLVSRAAKSGFRLVKCTYDEMFQRTVIREILAKILPGHYAILDAGRLSVRNVLEFLLDDFRKEFAFASAAFKHPSFAEEREWRLVSDPILATHPSLYFRPSGGMLIPYFEIDLTGDPAPFGAMVLGPNPHRTLAMNALRAFLWRLGMDNCKEIGYSEIPYRPL